VDGELGGTVVATDPACHAWVEVPPGAISGTVEAEALCADVDATVPDGFEAVSPVYAILPEDLSLERWGKFRLGHRRISQPDIMWRAMEDDMSWALLDVPVDNSYDELYGTFWYGSFGYFVVVASSGD
jgi:hypothetical protein